jgi:hypothetical protein
MSPIDYDETAFEGKATVTVGPAWTPASTTDFCGAHRKLGESSHFHAVIAAFRMDPPLASGFKDREVLS